MLTVSLAAHHLNSLLMASCTRWSTSEARSCGCAEFYTNNQSLSILGSDVDGITCSGSFFRAEPLILTRRYRDDSNLFWMVTVSIPSDVYYAYIMDSMYYTAAGTLVTVMVLCYQIVIVATGSTLHSRYVAVVLLLFFILMIKWVCVVKDNTNLIVKDAMRELSKLCSDYVTLSWHRFYILQQVASAHSPALSCSFSDSLFDSLSVSVSVFTIMPLYTLTITHSLSLVLVVMMRSKEFKIYSHADFFNSLSLFCSVSL